MFSTRMAPGLGLTPSSLRSRKVVRLTHGWYLDPADASDDPFETKLQILRLLPSDAVVSHWTAATLHRLQSRSDDRVHVTVLPRRSPPERREIVVHRSTLRDSDVTIVDGRRVTTADRTFLDLAPHLPLHELVGVGDRAIRRGLMTSESLAERMLSEGRRRGIVLARRAVPLLDGRAQSPPESFARVWLTEAGLPPRPQQPIRTPDGWLIGHCDLGYEEWRLGLEYEGPDHVSRRQFDYDVGRYTRMTAAGWCILRFSRVHLRANGAGLVQLTLDALRTRGYPG